MVSLTLPDGSRREFDRPVSGAELAASIGSRLAKKHPFVAIVFEMEGRRVWSLRSHAKGGLDVGEIARRRGGGGHKNAAGFVERLGAGE